MQIWTPARLAAAVTASTGIPTSARSLQLACERGEIPARKTAGGQWRITDDVVRRLFPSIGAR